MFNPRSHAPDFKLIILFVLILIFGLVMLTSASQVVGMDKFQDPYYHLKHQLIYGLLPGMAFLVIFASINYRHWKKIALPLFVVTIFLLLLVFLPQLSFSHAGAKRWIDLGFISFQPAELAKLATIIFFSAWFAKKGEEISNVHYTLLPFAFYLGTITALIAIQPDIGTLSVILITALAIYWTARGKILHIATIILIGILGFVIIIQTAPYRMARITSFLNPAVDVQGSSYQITQSMIAIGSGGIFGLGLGQSKQKYLYLPEVAGDSIFAVVAEELGFITTALFIIIYLYFIIICYNIAAKSSDNFGRYIAAGTATWFTYQALINIGSMLGMIPLTGLPFPFLSYGSSSFIVSLSAIGIVINISKFTSDHAKRKK